MNDTGTAKLRDADAEAYERDGCVCVRGALDKTWIARMRQAVDRITVEPGPMRETYYPDNPGMFFSEKFLWTVDPDFRAYVLDSPIAALAGRVMGSPKINIFYDHLLVKEPSTPSETAWHQDLNFWPFEGRQICSIWAPLDAVTLENGTLEFVRGSHLWYDRPMARTQIFGNRAGQPQAAADPAAKRVDDTPPQPDIEADRGRYDIVSWDMEPGDVIVFSALAVHHAPGNATAGRRRALSTRWLGDDMRFVRKTKMLQMIRDPGLQTGDPVTCELFPVVWQNAAVSPAE
ncbi:MAG: phytanoyl-CoA dioxygenase family protein [Rhodospirillales bacterium]|nr:phytanoyl-CoA dioxygenase family protein [Rhodospirillales bacterium]